MAKNKNKKLLKKSISPEANFIDSISSLEKQKADIIQKAFMSNDPDQIIKANEYIKSGGNVSNINSAEKIKSYLVDPYDFADSFGYKEKPTRLTYAMLSRMAGTPFTAITINTRVNQVKKFCKPQKDKYSIGFKIKLRNNEENPSTEDLRKIEELTNFLLDGGANGYQWGRDDFEDFIAKLVRDSLRYDQYTFECVENLKGVPVEFIATDSSTYRLATPNSEYVDKAQELKRDPLTGQECFPTIVQILNSTIENTFYPWELCFGIRRPRSDVYSYGYGYAELEELVQTITAMLYSDEYNRKFFSQGSAPKGILRIEGDNIDDTRLKEFKRQWQAQMVGVSNCLKGDTSITTLEGNFTIKEYLNGEEEKEVDIWTGKKFESGLVYRTDRKVSVKTKLQSNIQIESSEDHKFRSCNEEGEIVWKKQKELSLGDWILVGKKVYETDNNLYYKGKKIEPDLIEVLGWITGDGSIYYKGKRKQIKLFFNSEKELDILHEYYDILKKYNINVIHKIEKRNKQQRKNIKKRYGFKKVQKQLQSLQVFDAQFSDWLKVIGFNSSEEGKIIPNSIFTLPSKYRAAFLRGLYSADGNVGAGRCKDISLTCSKFKLRKDVIKLLLTLGIRTKGGYSEIMWTVNNFNKTFKSDANYLLRTVDRERFVDLIGFKQSWKQFREYIQGKEGSKTEKVPEGICKKYLSKCFYDENKDKFTVSQLRELKYVYLKRGMTINTFNKYLRILGDNLPELLDDFYFEKVTEIKVGKKVRMYDVQVNDDDHIFVANGMLISNSWKTPIMDSKKMEFIDLSKNNRDMEFTKWQEYLIKVHSAMFLIDPSELGFDISKSSSQGSLFESNNEQRIKYSKDKGLTPILRNLAKNINRYLIWRIDDRFEFSFVGDEAITEDVALDRIKKELDTYKTLDEIRAEHDMPLMGNENGGNMIFNPQYATYYNNKIMQESMANNPGGFEVTEEEDGFDYNSEEEGFDEDTEKAVNPFLEDLKNFINNNEG